MQMIIIINNYYLLMILEDLSGEVERSTNQYPGTFKLILCYFFDRRQRIIGNINLQSNRQRNISQVSGLNCCGFIWDRDTVNTRHDLRKCAKEVATIPDVVRNYFYDAMSWHKAQYGRSIDYAKIEGMYSGKIKHLLLNYDSHAVLKI